MSAPWTDTVRTDGGLDTFTVGDVTVHLLPELDYHPAVEEFFPQQLDEPFEPGAWYAAEPHVTAGRLRLNQQAFCLRTPDAVLLVDASCGNGKDRRNPAFDRQQRPWLEQLALVGLRPGDVDAVVLTHLHVDHVGFATTRTADGAWRPTFTRARHVVQRTELEYWTGPEGRARLERTGDYVADSVLPLRAAGLLDLVDGPHEVVPGVRLVPAPGHTPGNAYVEVTSHGSRALFVGDALHHAVQLARPAWSTRYCVDGRLAATARRTLLEQLAGTEDLLVATHLPAPTAGRVRRDGAGFRLAPVHVERWPR